MINRPINTKSSYLDIIFKFKDYSFNIADFDKVHKCRLPRLMNFLNYFNYIKNDK